MLSVHMLILDLKFGADGDNSVNVRQNQIGIGQIDYYKVNCGIACCLLSGL